MLVCCWSSKRFRWIAVLRRCELARDGGVPVVLDPAPVMPAEDVPNGFYGAADILTPNAWEAEALSSVEVTDVQSAELAAAKIREAHGCDCVIVTMAEKGVYVNSDGLSGHLPPFQVDAVATVAAGDAFAGVLGTSLVRGE